MGRNLPDDRRRSYPNDAWWGLLACPADVARFANKTSREQSERHSPPGPQGHALKLAASLLRRKRLEMSKLR